VSAAEGKLSARAEEIGGRLSGAGIIIDEIKTLANGLQLTIVRNGKWAKVNLYYSSRKGFSIVPSGGDADLTEEAILLSAERPKRGIPLPAIGQDEAGKGDYFGPLVVAAFYLENESLGELTRLGVADSKTLSDRRSAEISSSLRESFTDCLALVRIMPEDYNSRFVELRNEKRNSLDMLAEAHWRALTDLLSRGLAPREVLIDKFCSYSRFLSSSPEGFSANIELREKAEEEPCVAAASILARSAYIEALEELSEKAGVELVPGSGARADRRAKELLEKVGKEGMRQFAKLHFRNTAKLLGRAHP
jgi:ribonuclease HIII